MTDMAEQEAHSMGQRYPHMCRDGHAQIGHSDSEHEMCPLCRAYLQAETHAQLCRDILADLNGGGAQRPEFLANLRGRVSVELADAQAVIKSIA